MPQIYPRANFAPSTSSRVTLYCDGACTRQARGLAAGYGVHLDSPMYHVNICEPLSMETGHQTAQAAEVKALSSALEVVWANRPRHAVIVSDSEYVVKGYNEWMWAWKQNGWRKVNGEQLAYSALWKEIYEYPTSFNVRTITVTVKWKPRNSTEGQQIADALAR